MMKTEASIFLGFFDLSNTLRRNPASKWWSLPRVWKREKRERERILAWCDWDLGLKQWLFWSLRSCLVSELYNMNMKMWVGSIPTTTALSFFTLVNSDGAMAGSATFTHSPLSLTTISKWLYYFIGSYIYCLLNRCI